MVPRLVPEILSKCAFCDGVAVGGIGDSRSLMYMRRCRMNRNKRCQNSFVCFSNEKVIFVFVGLQYDSMKPNHAENVKK